MLLLLVVLGSLWQFPASVHLEALKWLYAVLIWVPLSLLSRLILGESRDLYISCTAMWSASSAQVMDELWVLSTATQAATGRRLLPLSTSALLPEAVQVAASDIVLLGVWGDWSRKPMPSSAWSTKKPMTIFIAGERTDGTLFEDQLVHDVDISLGHRRNLYASSSTSISASVPQNYLRLPWWLPYVLERREDKCTLPEALLRPPYAPFVVGLPASRSEGHSTVKSSGAAALSVVSGTERPNSDTSSVDQRNVLQYARNEASLWYERSHFTALLSSHEAYPRRLLFDAISTFAHDHHHHDYGTVDSPSGPFQNMEWPSHLENSHLSTGKLDFLRNYKFQITPENGKTWDRIPSTKATALVAGGYNTEKIAHAFLAGVIPIYWGDVPIDEGVFNNKRIIIFDDSPGGKGLPGVLGTMQQLLTNESFRIEWFQEPILAPTASQWVSEWCERFGSMMKVSLAKHGFR